MLTYTAEGNVTKEEYDKCELIILTQVKHDF